MILTQVKEKMSLIMWRRIVTAMGDASQLEIKSLRRIDKVRLPSFVTAVAGVVLLINLIMLFFGAVSTGVSSDEPTHVSRLQGLLDFGWYLPSFYLFDGSPTSGVSDKYVYGPVMALLAHFVAVFFGVETLGNVAYTEEAYAARHASIAFMGTIGIAASALIVKQILGCWRWALLAAATLSALPMWTGHAMFNIKDVPVATGYTLATLGLILLSKPTALTNIWLTVFTLIIGNVIAIGTRPGMWVAIFSSSVTMLGASYLTLSRQIGPQSALLLTTLRIAILSLSGVITFAVLFAIYPKAFSNPFSVAFEAATSSGKYEMWDGFTLTAGLGHVQPPPWWYIPTWFANQVPVLFLVFGLVTLLFITRTVVRSFAMPNLSSLNNAYALGSLLLMVQLLLMPLLAIFFESRLYNGIRQLLFIIPAWGIVTTLGVWLMYRTLGLRSNPSKVLVSLITVCSLALPTIDQLRLYPYNYAYFNEIATLRPINDRWATDYWRTSFRELAPLLPKSSPTICSPGLVKGRNTFNDPAYGYPFRPGSLCNSYPLISPYADTIDTKAKAITPTDTDFWYVRENQFGFNVPKNCVLESQVSRQLRQQSVMMSYLARCQTTFPQIPLIGVEFNPNSGSEYLLDGWGVPISGLGASSTGEQSRIGFQLSRKLQKKDLSISFVIDQPEPSKIASPLRVLINDAMVADLEFRANDAAVQFSIKVPETIASRYGRGRLLIAFQRGDNNENDNFGKVQDMVGVSIILKSLTVNWEESK